MAGLTRYTLIMSLALLAGCTSISLDYVGESYPPRDDVDVYNDVSEIDRAHKVMGQAGVVVSAGGTLDPSEAQSKLIAEAKARGADAVAFAEPERSLVGGKRSGGFASHGRNYYETMYVGYFLKYQ